MTLPNLSNPYKVNYLSREHFGDLGDKSFEIVGRNAQSPGQFCKDVDLLFGQLAISHCDLQQKRHRLRRIGFENTELFFLKLIVRF